MGDSTTHVRVTGDAGAMLARIRQELAALDRQVPMGGWTLSSRVDDAFRRVRVAGTLVTYASGLALFLSATGVYGLLSFAVNQRRREIAIRAALGAERRDLARLVVQQSAKLAGIGVVIGLIGADRGGPAAGRDAVRRAAARSARPAHGLRRDRRDGDRFDVAPGAPSRLDRPERRAEG